MFEGSLFAVFPSMWCRSERGFPQSEQGPMSLYLRWARDRPDLWETLSPFHAWWSGPVCAATLRAMCSGDCLYPGFGPGLPRSMCSFYHTPLNSFLCCHRHPRPSLAAQERPQRVMAGAPTCKGCLQVPDGRVSRLPLPFVGRSPQGVRARRTTPSC